MNLTVRSGTAGRGVQFAQKLLRARNARVVRVIVHKLLQAVPRRVPFTRHNFSASQSHLGVHGFVATQFDRSVGVGFGFGGVVIRRQVGFGNQPVRAPVIRVDRERFLQVSHRACGVMLLQEQGSEPDLRTDVVRINSNRGFIVFLCRG